MTKLASRMTWNSYRRLSTRLDRVLWNLLRTNCGLEPNIAPDRHHRQGFELLQRESGGGILQPTALVLNAAPGPREGFPLAG